MIETMNCLNESKLYQKSSNELGEGLFISRSAIYWLDIVNKKLFERFYDGILNLYDLPEQASAIWRIDESCVYLVSESGACTFDLHTHDWSIITPIPLHRKNSKMRTNDGVAIDENKCFMGTMEKTPSGTKGALYVIEDECIYEVLDNIGIPNSFINIKPHHYLVADSLIGVIYLLKFNETYTEIKEKTVWLDLSNEDFTPDGGCIDNDGNIYIAMWDGFCVHKYDRQAKLTSIYKLPVPRPTNCKLSTDNKCLFVTSAREGLSKEQLRLNPDSGSIFQIRL